MLAAALFMVGCSGPTETPEAAPSKSEATESETVSESAPAPSDGGGSPPEWDVVHEEGAPIAPGDEGWAEAAEGDAEAASTAAHSAVEAYFATDDPDAWWPEFSTHLTPAAQEVWKYTDPRRVPSDAPEGSADYGPVSATDAEVTVPTTIGDFQLVMVRADAGDPWKVSYMEPPEEVG